MLQSMGSQRVGEDLTTEQQQQNLILHGSTFQCSDCSTHSSAFSVNGDFYNLWHGRAGKFPHSLAERCSKQISSVQGNGTPLQYSCLENPMDGGAWWAAVHGVVKSWTRLRDSPFTFHSRALEKEMATHSSVLAWRIPGTGEPGGLPFMGSHRVRHD